MKDRKNSGKETDIANLVSPFLYEVGLIFSVLFAQNENNFNCLVLLFPNFSKSPQLK